MNRKTVYSHSTSCHCRAISSQAGAAGFQLNEYSTSALGRIFREGVIADDASAGSCNPAAPCSIALISVGAIHIRVSILKVNHLLVLINQIYLFMMSPNIHFVPLLMLNGHWCIRYSKLWFSIRFSERFTQQGLIGGKTDLKP